MSPSADGRTATAVSAGLYRDSVALLALARELRAMPGVLEAAALMGTGPNKQLLEQSGLLTADAAAARPNDLVIAVRARTAGEADRACARAGELLAARRDGGRARGPARPRTIESARRRLPGANLAAISVPGAFAAGEALKALKLGLHVMLWSDNVRVEDEVRLKGLAAERGLVLMGPDCGTAYLNGIPLGFANVVPRGRVGIVAASGTGLQQVATLLASHGEGISQAVGVGGRDLGDAVDGLMALRALDLLAADPETALIAVVAKPPAPSVRERVLARLRDIGKPAVVAMLGRGVAEGTDGRVTTVTTLEGAALAATAVLSGRPVTGAAHALPSDARVRVEDARRGLLPRQRAIRGLYAGGTLAHEAALIIERLAGAGSGHLAGGDEIHRVLDLGADEFTVGRAHPMLDPSARAEAIARAASEPGVAVLLLDVVLGHGAAADPAGDVAPALAAARETAREQGRVLPVVATVVGTPGDPQGLARQVEQLEAAGVWVLPSNAQAARAAACIAVGARAIELLDRGGPSDAGLAIRESGAVRRDGYPRPPMNSRPLFGEELRVVNVGLEGFASPIRAAGANVVHVEWAPPASGDAERAALLAELADEAE